MFSNKNQEIVRYMVKESDTKALRIESLSQSIREKPWGEPFQAYYGGTDFQDYPILGTGEGIILLTSRL